MKKSEEIKALIKKIESNRYFQLRESGYYEPWDMDIEDVKDMADDFYYLLVECLVKLENID